MLNYMTLGFRGSKNNTTDTIIDFEVYFNIFSPRCRDFANRDKTNKKSYRLSVLWAGAGKKI